MTYRYIDIVAKAAPLGELIGRDLGEITPRMAAIETEKRLAESAQDLLEALRECEWRLSHLINMDRHKLLDFVAQQKAREAIAKATGSVM